MLIAEPLFPFRLCVPADAEGGEGGAALLAACVWNQRWLLVTVAGAAPKPYASLLHPYAYLLCILLVHHSRRCRSQTLCISSASFFCILMHISYASFLCITVAGAAPKPPVVQHTLPSSLHSESRSPLKPPGLRQTSTP